MEVVNDDESIRRYLIVAATRDEYASLAAWWATTGLSELILKRWLFLSSGGYPLFSANLNLEYEIEGMIPSIVLRELRERRDRSFNVVKKVTLADHPDANLRLVVDNPPTIVSRGTSQTLLGKIGVIYNELNKPTIEDAELIAIASRWIVPYVDPSFNRMGPSGSPLSHSYYEALKEYFGVKTHLIANATDTYFTTFATQWPLGCETVGSRGNILNVSKLLSDEESLYELNLLFLGVHYASFLNYILTIILENTRSTIFVVHENVGVDDMFDAVSTSIIEDRVFSIYSRGNKDVPSLDQIRVLNLMLGSPRHRKDISIPFITDYERAVLVGTRAEQIARGSRPRVSVDSREVDPYPIAAREFAEKCIGLNIVRRYPNGEEEILDPDDIHVESHASPVNLLI